MADANIYVKGFKHEKDRINVTLCLFLYKGSLRKKQGLGFSS
jgi:hypothetical protein